MIKLQSKFSSIKNSNLIYLIENKNDLKVLDFLKLDKKIINKILDTLKKAEKNIENISLSFFLWDSSFENLYIYILNKKSKQTNIEFLWKQLIKTPINLTLFSNNDNNLITLVDTCLLSKYKFEKYKTKKEDIKINIFINKNNKKLVEERLKTIENICLARDLWETPSKDLTPEIFAKLIKQTKFKNTKVKILTYKELEKKWLGLIQAVWKWSSNKPCMVILERITNKKNPTYWFVWKWITFDSWWIQVKPGDHMYEMKWDMCWAASTYAVMKELDEKKLNVNIVACICLAENSISWDSYKPSDIITSYSWKTVEIIHTDAEWRLVLADGISYISKNYKLDNIVSIATLTWAVMVALWYRYAWIMWSDDMLIKKFTCYSKNNFEKYVELPLDNYFIQKTESDIADFKNLTDGIHAWSSMWGAFLSNFLLNWEKYTHIDIAGTAINSYEAYWLYNKWMTWFWVDSISKIFLDLK